jgi:hypothetical protein
VFWVIVVLFGFILILIGIASFGEWWPMLGRFVFERRVMWTVIKLHKSYYRNHESEVICNKLLDQDTYIFYVPAFKSLQKWDVNPYDLMDKLIKRAYRRKIYVEMVHDCQCNFRFEGSPVVVQCKL